MTDVPPPLRPPEVAATWGDEGVAESYRHRPKHPPESFRILAGLIVDSPRAVLDLGCGTGNVARPLASLVDRVDAVDLSAAMIAEGKRLPGGDDPKIRWIAGRAEDVKLSPPYALATAGDSLHWMDWTVVLPRVADALSPHGMLALLDVNEEVVGETEELRRGRRALVARYATYESPRVRLLEELQRRGLFREEGRASTEPVHVQQSVDDYVESFHAHAAHSWERMKPADAAAFDAELRRLMAHHIGEMLELTVRGSVFWGKPHHP